MERLSLNTHFRFHSLILGCFVTSKQLHNSNSFRRQCVAKAEWNIRQSLRYFHSNALRKISRISPRKSVVRRALVFLSFHFFYAILSSFSLKVSDRGEEWLKHASTCCVYKTKLIPFLWSDYFVLIAFYIFILIYSACLNNETRERGGKQENVELSSSNNCCIVDGKRSCKVTVTACMWISFSRHDCRLIVSDRKGNIWKLNFYRTVLGLISWLVSMLLLG